MCFLGVKFIFIDMILFEKGTIKDLVLSLGKPTIESPLFLFEFVNDITNEFVTFYGLNETPYTNRYYSFLVDVDDYFVHFKTGFWTYRVYEYQIEPEIKKILEIGKMKLIDTAFSFTEYTGQSEDFITYK